MTDSASNENGIEDTNLERDLDVIVGSDLKWREHVDRMVGKANRTLGMLKRALESREPEKFMHILNFCRVVLENFYLTFWQRCGMVRNRDQVH